MKYLLLALFLTGCFEPTPCQKACKNGDSTLTQTHCMCIDDSLAVKVYKVKE